MSISQMLFIFSQIVILHTLLSHVQAQANGEAARLAQMIEHLGGLPWLDMKATNLTVEGMKSGVRNSKVFVLLLTSDVLTRPFCLLEIKTAIDAGECLHCCEYAALSCTRALSMDLPL